MAAGSSSAGVAFSPALALVRAFCADGAGVGARGVGVGCAAALVGIAAAAPVLASLVWLAWLLAFPVWLASVWLPCLWRIRSWASALTCAQPPCFWMASLDGGGWLVLPVAAVEADVNVPVAAALCCFAHRA